MMEHHHIHDPHLRDVIPPPAHVTKHAHIKTTDEYFTMHRHSLENPERFWAPIAEQFVWDKRWDKVLDWEFRTPRIMWFEGGKLNITVNCLDRHVAAGFGNRPALSFEADDGASETYSYKQVLDHVCATAQVLEANGVRPGDRVALYMPMVPQVVFTMLACARMGAVHTAIFGGFSAEAVAERIVNAQAEVVVTADAGVRGGRLLPLKQTVDTAIVSAASRGVAVRRVLVHHRAGRGIAEGGAHWTPDRDVSLDAQVAEVMRHTLGRGEPAVTYTPASMGAEDPLFLLYTSGSTGKPKGVLHTTAGYMVWAATTYKYIFDTRPSAAAYLDLDANEAALNVLPHAAIRDSERASDRSEKTQEGWPQAPTAAARGYTPSVPGMQPEALAHSSPGGSASSLAGAELRRQSHDIVSPDLHFCTADVGWVTGHSMITYGPLLTGSHTLMFEGVPTYPDHDRLWEIVEKHRVTTLYTAPTALRALMVHGAEPVEKHDLSSLRILGSVGEPINAEAWRWLYEVVGKKRCPIIDTWWQTETGSVMISSLPGATHMKPGMATKPFFGVDARVVRADGVECEPEEAGSLVIDKPWPGIMRTVFGDHARFRKAYFEQLPGRYWTGDAAVQDKDGDIQILGRMDDVVNVSGHRLGTAEVESALGLHKDVVEAAVVGMPHAIKGEALYAYLVLREGAAWTPHLEHELVATVRKQIGAMAQPDVFHPTPDLPKTRSGKIMRRVLRKIAAGETDTGNMGDTSTLSDPGVVRALIDTRSKYMK